eukprot:144343_1
MSRKLGTPKQRAQSTHGQKGALYGHLLGSMSQDSDKWKLFQTRKRLGILKPNQLSGRPQSRTKKPRQRKRKHFQSSSTCLTCNPTNKKLILSYLSSFKRSPESHNEPEHQNHPTRSNRRLGPIPNRFCSKCAFTFDKKGIEDATDDDKATNDILALETSNISEKQTKCLVGLNFRDQLRVIHKFHELANQYGDELVFSKTGKALFGKKFDTDYPHKKKGERGTNYRQQARERIKQIVNDERRIRHMVAAGLGDRFRFTKGKSPLNPVEELIATQISMLYDANIKITSALIKQIAIKVTTAAGYQCVLPTNDEFMSHLTESETDNIKQMASKSQNTSSNEFTFTPTAHWLVNFTARYDFMWSNDDTREVNLVKILTNLEPTLLLCFILRRLYGIEPGNGQICNADQSMWYRFYESKKHYKLNNKQQCRQSHKK